MSIATKTVGDLVAEVLSKRDASEELAAQKKQVDAQCSALEAELSDLMNEQGLQSVKSTDGRSLYKSRDLFVSVKAADREAVVEACRQLGLDDLIKTEVPTPQLKARIKEWLGDLGDMEQVPEQLRTLVSVHEEYSIRVRKS